MESLESIKQSFRGLLTSFKKADESKQSSLAVENDFDA